MAYDSPPPEQTPPPKDGLATAVNQDIKTGEAPTPARAANLMMPVGPMELAALSITFAGDKTGAGKTGATKGEKDNSERDSTNKTEKVTAKKGSKSDEIQDATFSTQDKEVWRTPERKESVRKDALAGKWSTESKQILKEAVSAIRHIPGITNGEITSRVNEITELLNGHIDAANEKNAKNGLEPNLNKVDLSYSIGVLGTTGIMTLNHPDRPSQGRREANYSVVLGPMPRPTDFFGAEKLFPPQKSPTITSR